MKRTPDTMSDAIALSSPSGKMSKAARKRANERLRQALFGDGLPMPTCQQETDRERLLRQAAELRALAGRGMCPHRYIREAQRLETEAKVTDCDLKITDCDLRFGSKP